MQPSSPLPAETADTSYFDGNTWQRIGYGLLSFLVCALTLGIAYPWMLCLLQRWETKHTVIHGRRLRFTGRGHQLIGRYLLWLLFTILTLGIYSIWLGLGVKKWVVKHTVYADETAPVDSYFSGGAGGFFGIHLLAFLWTVFTLGIAKAWADKMVLCWEAKHTHIGGSPLVFDGTGGQLFGKYLLFLLLTPLTLGIYALFFPVIFLKWQIRHTEALYQTSAIRSQTTARETQAIQDCSRFRLAAAEQEIAAVRSGSDSTEDPSALEALAAENNPWACYRLAQLVKGDAPRYEGRALELLTQAADHSLPAALLDLACQLPPDQAVSLLEDAARCGSADAAWRLTEHYRSVGDWSAAAYWFRLALEWHQPDAVAHSSEYNQLLNTFALQLSEAKSNAPTTAKRSKTPRVLLAVFGGLLFLGLAGFAVWHFLPSLQPAFSAKHLPVLRAASPADPSGLPGEVISETLEDGSTLTYRFSPEVYYDRESSILYLSFALLDASGEVCLRSNGQWKELGPDQDWKKLSQIYGWISPPISVGQGLYALYDFTEDHMLYLRNGFFLCPATSPDRLIATLYPEVQTGDRTGAAEWLSARNLPSESGESRPSPNESDGSNESAGSNGDSSGTDSTAPSIAWSDLVGDWFAVSDSGDVMDIFEFTLSDDYTMPNYRRSQYMADDENGYFYFNGRLWILALGGRSTGTCTYDGRTLSAFFPSDGDTPESSCEWTVAGDSTSPRLISPNGLTMLPVSPLAGTWQSVELKTVEYEFGPETRLDLRTLTFTSYGTFSSSPLRYIYMDPASSAESPYMPVEDTSWGIPGMGFPSAYGDYSVDGSTLTLQYRFSDVEGLYDSDPISSSLHLSADGTLEIDGQRFYRGEHSLAELSALFDFPLH